MLKASVPAVAALLLTLTTAHHPPMVGLASPAVYQAAATARQHEEATLVRLHFPYHYVCLAAVADSSPNVASLGVNWVK